MQGKHYGKEQDMKAAMDGERSEGVGEARADGGRELSIDEMKPNLEKCKVIYSWP